MKTKNIFIKVLYFLTLICFIFISINVFFVSVLKIHPRSWTDLKKYVESGNVIENKIYAKRGNILDRNGNIIAQDVESYDIICVLDKNRITNDDEKDKAYVSDPEKTASALAEILGGDKKQFFDLLSQKNIFQTELGTKGRYLSKEIKDKIEKLKLPGVEFRKSSKRNYPLKNFAPYIVGFTQIAEDGGLNGVMGIEKQYDKYLKGTNGYESYEADNNGYILPGMKKEIKPALNGKSIYLTLDKGVQEAVNLAIDEAVEIYKPLDVWTAVAEVKTGRILGWGQYPTYNPNKVDIKDYLNRGTQYTYEPGSTFKPIIYAAAKDLGVYNATGKFDSGLFYYTSDSQGNPKRTYSGDAYDFIANFDYMNWGDITFDDGLIRSSNVATSTLLADYVGAKNFYSYVEKFGFFKPVNTDGFPEEVGFHNYDWAAEKLNMTFGQGISTNMLHMIQAYTSIFGNGEMIKPYFVEKIIDDDKGEVVYQHEKEIVGKPISEETARSMQQLLSRVLTDEYGSRHYAVKGVKAMAKTGTSQVARPEGGYDPNVEIISVMMGFPLDDPQYIVYFAIKADMPSYAHIKNTPPRHLVAQISKLLGTDERKKHLEEGVVQIVKNKMPNVLNLDATKAKENISQLGADVYILGDGKNIIKQYPEGGDNLYTKEKVFLLTSNENIKMPDMTGWTRKEVSIFWNVSNVEFIFKGVGVVFGQSIKKDEIIPKNQIVEIRLRDINIENSKELKNEESKNAEN